MQVRAVPTEIVRPGDNILAVIDAALNASHIVLSERSVLAVTSKVVAYSQSRLVSKADYPQKSDLVTQEADWFLPQSSSKYGVMLTIANGILAVSAGVDESNSIEGGYVLWPQDVQAEANQIWAHLRQKYALNQVGVVITDSKTTPLKWGVVGTALASCGFNSLKDYRGEKDLFGRQIVMEQVHIAEAVAVSAALVMGEVAEQTPLAIVADIPLIEFVDHVPTQAELEAQIIDPADDVYAPLLNAVKWQRGGRKKN